ncbi:hypothetical protein HRbin17_02296 [bacterium HR17]|uniref:Uncharacterized protein n=1 Tax=Candidatus Fervidibacter japonicus TaxID=2035412 RepID=A0A2H5XF21_9BACT|nr:hypothetical protein HRbin17_02296 [bacterium HR17]
MPRSALVGAVLLILWAVEIAGAAETDIRARAEVAYLPPYRIGDVARYRIAVVAPEQVKVIFPNPLPLAPFEVLGGGQVQRQQGALPGVVITVAEWDIAVYRLGKVTIPSVPISCEWEGRRTLVRTNPIALEVVPLTSPKDQQPRPPKPPLPYPLDPIALTLLAAGTLTAVAVTWLVARGLIWALRTAWSSLQQATARPPLPAHQLALQTIDRAEQLYRQGETERAFTLLSFGVRRYLRDRFQVPALELPTWQLQSYLQPHLPADLLRTLYKTLTLSDLIKFARYNPTDTEAQQLFADARQLIRTTQPVEPPAQPRRE